MSFDIVTSGFYNMSQLASRQETQKQKAYIGVFPWSKSKINKMVKAGTFPKPVSDGYQNLWRKDVIHEFIEKVSKEGGFE